MKFQIQTADPFKVLASTKGAVETARFVSINGENLAQIAEKIEERFKKGLGIAEMGLHSAGGLRNDLQLIFLEDAVNFCFWAEKDAPKWQIGGADGTWTTGGLYGLQACFGRGLKNRVPILDARRLVSLSMDDAAEFFIGANGVQIPLFEERVENLREAGRVLTEKFDGEFSNVMEAAGNDAVKITHMAIEYFPSFRDVSVLDGKDIFFYKRAQILAQDVSYIVQNAGGELHNLDRLTAFADYKLPQMLRMYGVLGYEEGLARRIDGYVQILHDSREEIEIRAATIWAVELLRQHLTGMTAAEINNAIWLMSQDVQGQAKPYHRTRTIFY
jgi:hypothetical protein